MADCPECKDSILNNQTSNIANPKCVDCDYEVDCEGITTSSACVTVNVALDCIDSEAGDTLTEVLQELDDKVCEAVGGTVKVSVSEPDTCPGYLEDKIIEGDGIEVTKVAGVGNCQTLVISETCRTWTDVLPLGTGDGKFQNGWFNADPGSNTIQVAQYSSVKECSVRLRGGIKKLVWDGGNTTIFTLPVGKRPEKIRWFHASADFGNSLEPATILIFPNGIVTIALSNSITTSEGATSSLDGIEFEIA